MILYVLKQNKNEKSSAYQKWFAYPVIEETIELDGLAEHMSNHNTPFSKGAIKGMLTDMVSCRYWPYTGRRWCRHTRRLQRIEKHPGRETTRTCHGRTVGNEHQPGSHAEKGHRHHEGHF